MDENKDDVNQNAEEAENLENSENLESLESEETPGPGELPEELPTELPTELPKEEIKTGETSKKKSDEPAKKDKVKKKKPGKLAEKFLKVREEYKKVIWAPFPETVKRTVTVIIVSIAFGLVIFAMDSFFNFSYEKLAYSVLNLSAPPVEEELETDPVESETQPTTQESETQPTTQESETQPTQTEAAESATDETTPPEE
jgi:preprotein translocase SecE subunit